jgi:hypothetical protein
MRKHAIHTSALLPRPLVYVGVLEAARRGRLEVERLRRHFTGGDELARSVVFLADCLAPVAGRPPTLPPDWVRTMGQQQAAWREAWWGRAWRAAAGWAQACCACAGGGAAEVEEEWAPSAAQAAGELAVARSGVRRDGLPRWRDARRGPERDWCVRAGVQDAVHELVAACLARHLVPAAAAYMTAAQLARCVAALAQACGRDPSLRAYDPLRACAAALLGEAALRVRAPPGALRPSNVLGPGHAAAVAAAAEAWAWRAPERAPAPAARAAEAGGRAAAAVQTFALSAGRAAPRPGRWA